MRGAERLRTSLWVALGLVACGEVYETEQCLELPEDGVCLEPEQVREDLLGNSCGYKVLSIEGPAVIKPLPWEGFADTDQNVPDGCCYPVRARNVDDGCVIGRPLVVDGVAATAPATGRADWAESAEPCVHGLSELELAQLGAAWLRTAAGEHASVGAFSRLSLELLRLGAPSSLVRAAHEAALDEVQHAEQAYALAGCYLGREVGPGPLPLPDQLALVGSAAELALAAAAEGCRDETLAALLAAEAAERASDPAVRRVLAKVAADEARHAALSWRVLSWALSLAPEVVPAVEALLTAPPVPVAVPEPDAAALVAHGVLGPAATWEVHQRGMARVVAATWRGLRAAEAVQA